MQKKDQLLDKSKKTIINILKQFNQCNLESEAAQDKIAEDIVQALFSKN